MRDSDLINAFKQLDSKIHTVSQNSAKGHKSIASNTMQLNAILAMLKLIPPLYWLFKKYFKIENEKYYKQLIQARKTMGNAFIESQQKNKEVNNNEKKEKDDNIGRNKPCKCGSGQKYKKCCLNKEKTEKK